jgi:two-component system phosphate regulon response regulator PhoB
MTSRSILIVEDDEDILELIAYNLKKDGAVVTETVSGEAALKHLDRHIPDLILLDLMLPEMDGLELCRRVKTNERTAQIPIIMVTARGEETDVVTGLELGADDYVTKPFRPKELVARVRAVLRRSAAEPAANTDAVTVGEIFVNPVRREVRVSNEAVDLTFTEFEILHYLARHPGMVFTRYQIVDAVHGQDYPVTDRSVDVQVVGLRKKLGAAGHNIETVRGVGYRLSDQSR